jgi:acyl-coenzyme A synthetase/AMP-(fatty) acid ligase
MTIFSSKATVQVPTESLWDYILGAEDQTRSQAPIIFDVDDPDTLHLSAADVATHARRFAETLTAAGIRPEDRVLFVYQTSIYSAPFFLATYLVGATFIPLSAGITHAELQVIFDHSKPTAIVFQPGGVDLGRALKVESEAPTPLLLCLDTSTPSPSLYSLTPENSLPSRSSDLHVGAQTARSANSACLILYTSGTSGTPKGWMYSEKTLLAGIAHLVLSPWPTKLTFDGKTSVGMQHHRIEAKAHDKRPNGPPT